MPAHPLDTPITSVILGGCDPPEVRFASLALFYRATPVMHLHLTRAKSPRSQTTLPLNLPSLRHIAATETTRALFPSLLDVGALDERFAQGHLTFGVDAIGARFVDNAQAPGSVRQPAPTWPEPHGSWVPLIEAAWLERYGA